MKSTFLQPSLRVVACLALLGAAALNGQQTAPAPPPGGAGNVPRAPTPTPNIPTNPRNPTNTPGNLPQQDTMQRPMFLSGKVMLSDGTPPPDSVKIERVCGGRIIPEGMTDRKGRFSFQIGQNSSMLMDASDSGPFRSAPGMTGSNNPMGGIRERDLFSCELRAYLPGFRSDVVNLANRKFMDNPEVGTIILHRLGNVEGLTISATSMAAPKDAKKAFDKGHDALAKNKLDDAQKHFEKAVETYPKYAAAWYELGVVNGRQKNVEAAKKDFAEALAADPKFISPYEDLAQMAASQGKWEEVADITDKMIKLNPVDFPKAYFYNAVAKLNLNKLDDAEKSVKELIQMDPGHQVPKAEHVLGIILAQKQDIPGAAAHLRKFIAIAQPGADLDLAKKQLAEVEKSLAAREQSK